MVPDRQGGRGGLSFPTPVSTGNAVGQVIGNELGGVLLPYLFRHAGNELVRREAARSVHFLDPGDGDVA